MSYERTITDCAEDIRTLRMDLLIEATGGDTGSITIVTIEAIGIYDAASGHLISVETPDGRHLSVEQVESVLTTLGVDHDEWKRPLCPARLGEMLYAAARDEDHTAREYAASAYEHAAE